MRYTHVLKKMLVGKFFGMIFNKKAESAVISAVILTGAAITLGFVVLSWGQSKSSDYAKNYSDTTDAEIAKLKEKLTVEYVFYDRNSNPPRIRIFLLNSGAINDVKIQSVYVRSSTGENWVTSDPILKSFNHAPIPDLDMGGEGYVDVSVTLQAGTYYFVRIVTGRGSIFEAEFVA
jgi:hypothetical protein